MTPHLVALDIDGTTVNHEGHLSDAVRDAVREVAEAGHHVTIATGRAIVGTLPVLDPFFLGSFRYAAGVLPPVVLALIALWAQMVCQLKPSGVVTLRMPEAACSSMTARIRDATLRYRVMGGGSAVGALV